MEISHALIDPSRGIYRRRDPGSLAYGGGHALGMLDRGPQIVLQTLQILRTAFPDALHIPGIGCENYGESLPML